MKAFISSGNTATYDTFEISSDDFDSGFVMNIFKSSELFRLEEINVNGDAFSKHFREEKYRIAGAIIKPLETTMGSKICFAYDCISFFVVEKG